MRVDSQYFQFSVSPTSKDNKINLLKSPKSKFRKFQPKINSHNPPRINIRQPKITHYHIKTPIQNKT